MQLDNQSITTRNRMFISSTDMQKYGFYSAGVCISHRCVIGGLGWVKKNGPTSISDIHCTAQFINRHSAPRPPPQYASGGTSIVVGRSIWCIVYKALAVTSRRHQYDTRRYFSVRSKADMSQLNLPHGTDNNKAERGTKQ